MKTMQMGLAVLAVAILARGVWAEENSVKVETKSNGGGSEATITVNGKTEHVKTGDTSPSVKAENGNVENKKGAAAGAQNNTHEKHGDGQSLSVSSSSSGGISHVEIVRDGEKIKREYYVAGISVSSSDSNVNGQRTSKVVVKDQNGNLLETIEFK